MSLTVTQVAEIVQQRPEAVRRLVRDGRFPAPIDPGLHPRQWRWADRLVALYDAGLWSPADPLGLEAPTSSPSEVTS